MCPEPIRVCHVITRLIVGGAQENTVLSCALVDPARFRSVLVTGPETGPEGSLHEEAGRLGVRTVVGSDLRRSVSPVRDLRALIGLVRLFRAERPHIVHTHSSKAGVVGRLAARLAGVPAIVHTVHGWPFHDHMAQVTRTAWIRTERLAAGFTHRLVFVSDADREGAEAYRIGERDRHVTIRSGVDLDRYRGGPERRAAARSRLGIGEHTPVVGAVMRLSAQKDPVTLVEAIRIVAERIPDVRLVIVGDGPLRTPIERRIVALGLGDRVVLTGLRHDVEELLPGFDVLSVTSLWEGMPRVVAQAMSAGVPIIASAVGGIPDTVRDSQTGLLFRPGDHAGLADSIVRLLSEPGLARRVATAARPVAERFSLQKMITDLEDLYTSLGEERLHREGQTA